MKTCITLYEGEQKIYTFKDNIDYIPRKGELIHLLHNGIYRVLNVCHAIISDDVIWINIFVKQEKNY